VQKHILKQKTDVVETTSTLAIAANAEKAASLTSGVPSFRH